MQEFSPKPTNAAALNESPSEKEGKSGSGVTGSGSGLMALNESPSEKEGKLREPLVIPH